MNSMVDVEDPAYVQTTEGNKMSAEVQPNQMTFSRHNKNRDRRRPLLPLCAQLSVIKTAEVQHFHRS